MPLIPVSTAMNCCSVTAMYHLQKFAPALPFSPNIFIITGWFGDTATVKYLLTSLDPSAKNHIRTSTHERE